MKGTCLKGRYLIGEVIGKGGMAVVYKAYDFRSGRTVAVKVLREQYSQDEEFVRRFAQEAESASTVSHENLIDIYDVGEQSGTRFIVMEYVDGMTLKSLIKDRGALDNYSAITIARQICTALQIAHEAHIIHRDIKPQNILLGRKGVAKLADFGIAKTTDTQTITQTGDNGVLGSVHYFSPEQARGETAGVQSDLYSLGVVTYEMVTSKLPFEGDTAVAIALHHMNSQATPPMEINAQVTPALNEVIMKAIRKRPGDRYQSAREFYDDLSMALVYPEGGFVEELPQEDSQSEPPAIASTEKTTSVKTDRGLVGDDENRPGSDGKKRVHPLKIALAGLCMLMLVVLVIFYNRSNWFNAPVNVPSLIGANVDSASARLDDLGLVLNIKETTFDDVVLPGVIVEQQPIENTKLKQGDMVDVIVCMGPENARLLDFTGMTLEEAQAALGKQGFALGTLIKDQTSQSARNTVIGQDIPQGTLLQNGAKVALVISDPPLVRTVPLVIGSSLNEAKASIESAGLKLGTIYSEYATGYDIGTVFKQLPEGDTQLREGDPVNIWVVQEVPLATCQYELVLDISKNNSEVSIYVEENTVYQEVYSTKSDRGKLEIELNLESESAGEKELIIMVNDSEYKREIVTFVGENA